MLKLLVPSTDTIIYIKVTFNLSSLASDKVILSYNKIQTHDRATENDSQNC